MALGRAFIEVHADLTPFKKDLGKGIATLLKQTQAAVDKAVREGMQQAQDKVGGGKAKSPVIKPKLDTTDIDRDSDRVARGLEGALKKGFKGAVGQFNKIFEDLNQTSMIATLVSAAVVASPLIAAAIGGAISLGIGLAGIGAGIALAFQDSRIKSSAAKLGDFVKDGFTSAADSFLRPMQRAIDLLYMGFERFFPRIERGFAAIAPYVDDLAIGFNDFLDALGPGLEAAFGNAGPFIQIFAEYLPVIGDALGYMFEEITANAGARAGLVAFFQVAADLIIFTTDAITFLSDAFGVFVMMLDRVPPVLMPDSWEADVDEMIAAMLLMPGPAEAATHAIQGVGGGAAGAAGKARDLTASLNEFFGAQLGWVDANINFEASIDKVADSFKENGNALSATTAKGRENLSAVNDSIKAAIRARDAKIKETGSVAAGNAVYSTNIERLRGVLLKAGLTKTQIDKLIGSYDKIPPEVSTEVSVPGLSGALSQAQLLRRELELIQHDKLSSQRGKGDGHSGGYAEGGIVTRQELAWVGEGNRPEAIIPLTNPGRAAEIMAEAGLMGMGGGTIVVQMVLDGKVIDERIVRTNQGAARRLSQKPRMI